VAIQFYNHSRVSIRVAGLPSFLIFVVMLLFQLQVSQWIWNVFSLWFLISFSVTGNDIAYLFICLGHLCIFFEEIFIQILCIFKGVTFCFLLLNYKVLFCMLFTSPLSDTWFANILSYSVCHFNVLDNVLFKHEVLIWIKFYFIFPKKHNSYVSF
jgi:hypothetical protein